MFAISSATILVLAPHTDDGELGAGASIAKWADQGNDVHYAAFSACESIAAPDDRTNSLRSECAAATSLLGIPSTNLEIFSFEVRRFTRERQEILDVMVELNKAVRPDLVLMPSTDDTHQDHETVAREARRAFKRTRMLGYEVPWNQFRFDSSAFSTIEEDHLATKCDALARFTSQAGRPYMNSDYIRSQALTRGVQSGVPLAEAFQVLRWYL